MNDSPDNLIYLLLVQKGFNQQVGFECLQRIRTDFERFFSAKQMAKAKAYSLNNEFQGMLKRAHVKKNLIFFLG